MKESAVMLGDNSLILHLCVGVCRMHVKCVLLASALWAVNFRESAGFANSD